MKLFLYILFAGILISSCNKKIEQPELDATFQVREIDLSGLIELYGFYDTDSVSTAEAQLYANEPETPLTRYEWKIGTDPRTFTGKSVRLDYRQSPTDHIQVTLTVFKINPSDNTIQTKSTSRIFYIRSSSVPGKYAGYFEGSSQKVEVEIKLDSIMIGGWYPQKGLRISSSLPQFNLFTKEDEYTLLNSRIYYWGNPLYENTSALMSPRGTINLLHDQSIRIDMKVNRWVSFPNNKEELLIKFAGKRK